MPLEGSPAEAALGSVLAAHTRTHAGTQELLLHLTGYQQQHQYEAVVLATPALLAATPRQRGGLSHQLQTIITFFFTPNECLTSAFERLLKSYSWDLTNPQQHPRLDPNATPDERGVAFIDSGRGYVRGRGHMLCVPRYPIHRDKRQQCPFDFLFFCWREAALTATCCPSVKHLLNPPFTLHLRSLSFQGGTVTPHFFFFIMLHDSARVQISALHCTNVCSARLSCRARGRGGAAVRVIRRLPLQPPVRKTN